MVLRRTSTWNAQPKPMPKRPKYRESDFPPPGTVFVAPTSDGRLAAGRVLRRQFEGGAQAALVAATPWLGTEPPPLHLPALRETLVLNHHSHKNRPEIFWAQEVMPPDFQIVGEIELSADDLAATSDIFGGWQGVTIHALKQWRWDHDREALLRDEALEKAERAETQRKQAEARAELMRTLTLDSLATRTWFESWEDVQSNLPVHECRALMSSLVNDLRAAPKLTMAVVRRRLKESVKDFNHLDKDRHFISTIEREDLCEAYEQILCAARFPQLADEVDQWRQW